MPNAVGERLDGRVLTTSIQTLIAPPVRTELTLILLAKLTTSGTPTAKFWHVPKDATLGDEHLIASNVTFGAALALVGEGSGITLSPGDTLQAQASAANALVATLYGVSVKTTGG